VQRAANTRKGWVMRQTARARAWYKQDEIKTADLDNGRAASQMPHECYVDVIVERCWFSCWHWLIRLIIIIIIRGRAGAAEHGLWAVLCKHPGVGGPARWSLGDWTDAGVSRPQRRVAAERHRAADREDIIARTGRWGSRRRRQYVQLSTSCINHSNAVHTASVTTTHLRPVEKEEYGVSYPGPLDVWGAQPSLSVHQSARFKKKFSP